MKHVFLFFLMLLVGTIAHAQIGRVPDLDNPQPGAGWFYYENRGQIIDQAQNIRNDIKYYTLHSGMKMYLGEDTISFTGHNVGIIDTLAYDTSFRLDMQFWCNDRDIGQTCPNMLASYETSSDILNYYLPHCGPGGIENVPGYAGVVYQNAFSNTDVHFFSSELGPINYYVFHPGADTADFALLFTGQDSIQAIANTLHVYLKQHDVPLSNCIAYQVDNSGNVLPLTWTPSWYVPRSGIAKLQLGAYNASYDLVVRVGIPPISPSATAATDNLIWATYYGGGKRDATPDSLSRWSSDGLPVIKSSSSGNAIYHAMTSNSDAFDLARGNTVRTFLPLPFSGNFDCVLSSFDPVNAQRLWATFYGGTGYEEATALETVAQSTFLSSSIGNLLLAGRTQSSNLPLGTASVPYQKTTNTRGMGAFVASFGASNGSLKYATYFGGGDHCYINDLTYDPFKNETVFCGYVSSPRPWNQIIDTTNADPPDTTLSLRRAPGRFYQDFDMDGESGFVGAFDSTRNLVWCSLLGGNHRDYLNEVVTDRSIGLYVLGNTKSTPPSGVSFTTGAITSPFANLPLPLVIPTAANSYWQIRNNIQHGLIVHFNGNRAIDWGTLFGASGDEEYTGIAVNSHKDLYIAGTTNGGNGGGNNLADNSGDHLPIFTPTGTYTQGPGSVGSGGVNNGRDAIIARFDSTHVITWCSFFGRKGSEFNPVRLKIDHADDVFMSGNNEIDTAGTVQGIPIFTVAGRYQQDSNASAPSGTPAAVNTKSEASDGWIVQFNPSNQGVWSTHYGGVFPGAHTATVSDLQDARERISSIDIGINNGKVSLFMTGITKNPKTPMLFNNLTPRRPTAPSSGVQFWEPTHGGDWDAFIGFFNDARQTKVETSAKSGTAMISVAPNPSHDRFTVTFSNANSGTGKVPVIVTNAFGQVLFSRDLNLVQGENKFILNLESQPAGMYFLQIALGNEKEAARLIKY